MTDHKPTLEEMNEKLDKLLAHQRNAMIWGVIRSLISLAIFIMVVVLPSYYAYDFYKNPNKYIDSSKFTEYQKTIQDLLKKMK